MRPETDHLRTSPEDVQIANSAATQTAKESLLYLPGKLVMAATGFAIVPIFTYFFTEEEIGQYDLAMRLALFLATIFMLWQIMVTLRFYPAYQRKEQEAVFFSGIGFLRLIGLGFGAFAGLALWLAGPKNWVGSFRHLLDAALLVFFGRSLFELGLAMLRIKQRPGVYSVAATANGIGKVGLGVLLAVGLKLGMVGVLWGAAAVNIIVYFIALRRHLGRLRIRPTSAEREFLTAALAYGLPICCTLTLGYLLGNVDRYFLNAYRGEDEVGIYAIGYILSDQAMVMVYSTLMLAVFPAVTRAYETAGREAAETLTRSVTRNYLLLSAPVAMLLAVLAKPILYAVAFGETRTSFVVVPWLAAAGFLLGLSQYPVLGIHLAKRPGFLLISSGVAIVVNVGCNLYLIPSLGYYACGICRLISNAVLLMLVVVISRLFFRWRFPFKSCVRIVIACTIVGASLYCLAGGLVVDGPFALRVLIISTIGCGGFLAYGILLFVLGEISRDEAASALRYFRKLRRHLE